jgi:2,3-dihydroxyphenylpropionate 1,2-dioxygenase
MITGAVCMSHSPLLDRNRANADSESKFWAAVNDAESFASSSEPEITIVFFPDHLSGFFYGLMPSFCIGAAGTSIGDYGTAPGALDIPEAIAADCAAYCIRSGVDVALSYKMTVDHGAVQPLELLSSQTLPTKVIPVFVNCAAPPRPTFERVRALGRAVGGWAAARPERICIVASGGLSHDPPIPLLTEATDEVRDRMINGGQLGHRDRTIRQNRILGEGQKFVAGTSQLRPLNPDWDNAFLKAVLRGDLKSLDNSDDEEITNSAGSGGHEVRSWIAALSALKASAEYEAKLLFYAPMPEWITGVGVLTASPA